MSHNVRCPCLGNPACKLCGGSGFYAYQPGERGWMPFTCPTCEGKRELSVEDATEKCFTCHGVGSVDPAIPPRDRSTRGYLRDVWRIFFGG